jgi:hypothetical protein
MRNYRIRPRDQFPTVIPPPAVIVREDPLAMRARHARIRIEAHAHQLEFVVAELRADNQRHYLLWQNAERQLKVLRAAAEVK